MRKIYALLVLFALSLLSYGQSDSTTTKPVTNKRFVDYDNVSPWFFGLNVGATWQSTDVKNKLDYGFGATFGRSFMYKQGSPVFFDLRLRYLRAFVSGQDYDTTSAVQYNPALNGTNYADINYNSNPGYGINNFQTDVHRAALELAIHYNKLRERKGIDLYIFGGAGLTFSKTMGNLKTDGDTAQYDYASLASFGKNDIKDLLDNTYETALDGSSRKHSVKFMPSLGIGIGYQINPRFSLGLEHKTTFTGTDLFDGTDRNREDFSVSGNKDLYHYTSFYLRFHLRKRKPLPRPIPQEPIIPQNPTTHHEKRPPVVEIYDPNTSPYRTTQPYFNLKAKVYYVSGKQDIRFKQNGNISQNFTYNSSTNEFQSHVALKPGQNIFEITGTNQDGSYTDATTIILEVPNPVQPPIVTISNPPFSPYQTSNQYFDLRGKVLNVDYKNQVSVFLNGQTLSNFNFNTGNGNTSSNLSLREGQNTVTIKGVNQAGQDQKTVYINYKRPVQQQPPVVDFIDPIQYTTTVQSMNYDVAVSVLNVTQKNQIRVYINGNSTNGFTYNHSQRKVQLNTNLIIGANIIKVVATNTAGSDQETRTIIYRRQETMHPPVVTFLNPSVNPTTVYSTQYNVLARVNYVSSKSQISVKINGIATNNFTFSPSSKQVNLQSSLINGANIFEITATNNAGQDQETTTIIHRQEHVENPPVVNIQMPSVSPFTVFNPNVKLIASVLNVTNSSNITVKVNGVPTTNFTYDLNTKILKVNRTLVLGNNLFQITATNLDGTDSDQTTVIYRQQAVPRPTAVWLNPNSNSLTTHQASYFLTGKVTNVSTKNQVVIKKNGVVLGQNLWSFNTTTKVVTLNTGLILGNNTFEIIATNNTGSSNDVVNIIYEEEPCENPTIQFITPANNNINTENDQLELKVKIYNPVSADAIVLKLNGVIQNNVSYNSAANEITKTITLNEGNNVIQVHAGNDCGITNASRVITYTPAEIPCNSPTIQAIQPQQTVSTYDANTLVKATLHNIENNSQVQFKVNGITKPFDFDPATHILTSTIGINLGANSCQIIVQNDCGAATYTWNINRLKCTNPIINITAPTASNLSTENETLVLSGLVYQIESNSQLEVKHNGTSVSFVFNPISKTFAANRNLTPGINQFVVKATNGCGSVTKTVRVTYNEPVVANPPTVNVISPNTSPFVTMQQSISLRAVATDIPHKSQVMVWINNVQTQSFTYNPSSGAISIQKSLNVGNNVFKIRVVNESGSDEKTVVVKRNVLQVQQPAIVRFVSPTKNTTYHSASYYNVVAYADNVTNFNNIKVYINNQLFTGYSKKIENGNVKITFTLPLSSQKPVNVVKITASNSAGNNQKSKTIHYVTKGSNKVTPLKKDVKKPGSTNTKGKTPVKKPTTGRRN